MPRRVPHRDPTAASCRCVVEGNCPGPFVEPLASSTDRGQCRGQLVGTVSGVLGRFGATLCAPGETGRPAKCPGLSPDRTFIFVMPACAGPRKRRRVVPKVQRRSSAPGRVRHLKESTRARACEHLQRLRANLSRDPRRPGRLNRRALSSVQDALRPVGRFGRGTPCLSARTTGGTSSLPVV